MEKIQRNDARVHPKGETLPTEMRLFRYDLVETCLKAGMPIAKIDCMRPFLQKYGYRLTSSGHFSETIQFVQKYGYRLTSSGHFSETIQFVLEKEKETLKTFIVFLHEILQLY